MVQSTPIPSEAVNTAVRLANEMGLNSREVVRMVWNPPESGTDDPNGSWTCTFKERE